MGIFSSIDEAITVLDVLERIEHRVLSGVPVKNHVGRIRFVDLGNGRSRVEFFMEFDSVFPGLGSLLRIGLQRAVIASLRNIEAQFL